MRAQNEPPAFRRQASVAMELEGRWRDLDNLLNRPGMITGPGFEPAPELREFLATDCRVLIVGAGGLGCELVKVGLQGHA